MPGFLAEATAQRILPLRSLIVRTGCIAAAAFIFAAPLMSQTGQGDDLIIGVSAALTGQSSGLGTELSRGADAYIRYVNENGGIHGHRKIGRAHV